MKLDLNCMRDTLLYLEDWLVLNDELEFIPLSLWDIQRSGTLQKYSLPVMAYAIIKMEEAGFVVAAVDYANNAINDLEISSLTYSGHQFLDTIRPQALWDKIHAISEKSGLKSISALMEIADILLPETIKSALHS